MNIIVAVYSDWGIGYYGAQTIVIPEDRRRFRKITSGGVVIAGRKTFEEIGRPLPDRKNIVLTHDMSYMVSGAEIAHSIDEVLELVADEDPGRVFVIGGSSVYNMFLSLCAYAYVTKIEATPPSDAFFPDLDTLAGWSIEDSETGILNVPPVASRRFADKGVESGFTAGTGTRYSFCLYKNNNVLRSHNHV